MTEPVLFAGFFSSLMASIFVIQPIQNCSAGLQDSFGMGIGQCLLEIQSDVLFQWVCLSFLSFMSQQVKCFTGTLFMRSYTAHCYLLRANDLALTLGRVSFENRTTNINKHCQVVNLSTSTVRIMTRFGLSSFESSVSLT